MRSPVARGSMPYSAVTQPLPLLRSQGGIFSSRLAVHSTCVSPNFTRQEPSACLETLRSKETVRIWSVWRLDGRIRLFLWNRTGGGLLALRAAMSAKKNGHRRHVLFAVRAAIYIQFSTEVLRPDDSADHRSEPAIAR